MPLLSRLEKALERLAEGGAERIFGGRLDLVAVGQELYNSAGEHSKRGESGLEAPNSYHVYLALDDYGAIVDHVEPLQERYERALWRRLRETGYAVAGVPRVLVTSGEAVGRGRFDVAAAFAERRLTCWLSELDVEGVAHRLRLPATIGRAEGCDLALSDSSISRCHAELIWDRNCFCIVDLNSKNGTFVEGRQVSTSMVEPGDTLMLGDKPLALALDDDRSEQ